MLAAWRAEGVGTGLVVRVPGKLPGLYLIDTDADGQRHFYYWRDSAPARLLFDLPQNARDRGRSALYDLVYLSGVTLSLYGESGRARLLDALDMVRARGGRIAFDTNFRTRGWPDREIAKAAFRASVGRADIVLASTEDLELLFVAFGVDELPTRDPRVEVVLKLAQPAVLPASSWAAPTRPLSRSPCATSSTPRPWPTASPPPISPRASPAPSRRRRRDRAIASPAPSFIAARSSRARPCRLQILPSLEVRP